MQFIVHISHAKNWKIIREAHELVRFFQAKNEKNEIGLTARYKTKLVRLLGRLCVCVQSRVHLLNFVHRMNPIEPLKMFFKFSFFGLVFSLAQME